MTNLAHRQQKIQEKRKKTPWRDFVMEIASWYPINMYKNDLGVSIYPYTQRKQNIIPFIQFDQLRGGTILNDDIIDFYLSLSHLFVSTPLPGFHHYYNAENTTFANHVSNTKNAYLSFHTTGGCENVLYSLATKIHVKNIYNSVMSWIHSENIFQSLGAVESYNVFYSRYIKNSNNIWFSNNLVGCQECLFCNFLQNKSYCIDNQQYDKEVYLEKKKVILKKQNQFENWYHSQKHIGENIGSVDVTGIYCTDSEAVQDGYYSHFVKNARNIIFGGHPDGLLDSYDAMFVSAGNSYFGACAVGGDSERIYTCISIMGGFDCYYSYFLENCSFCLGCIGLKNKSYCILNKQYSKEERYEKVDEIFAQMDADGTLGQFFPATMNPFYFNDTAAYLIDPSFTKEEVTAKGYLWRDEPIKVDIPEGMEVVKTSELGTYEGFDNEGNRTINADILKKVIQDDQGNVYRIIPMEYKFLVKHGLPLPRKHRLERMKENFRIQ